MGKSSENLFSWNREISSSQSVLYINDQRPLVLVICVGNDISTMNGCKTLYMHFPGFITFHPTAPTLFDFSILWELFPGSVYIIQEKFAFRKWQCNEQHGFPILNLYLKIVRLSVKTNGTLYCVLIIITAKLAFKREELFVPQHDWEFLTNVFADVVYHWEKIIKMISN